MVRSSMAKVPFPPTKYFGTSVRLTFWVFQTRDTRPALTPRSVVNGGRSMVSVEKCHTPCWSRMIPPPAARVAFKAAKRAPLPHVDDITCGAHVLTSITPVCGPGSGHAPGGVPEGGNSPSHYHHPQKIATVGGLRYVIHPRSNCAPPRDWTGLSSKI